METEKQISRINDGNMARLILQNLGPILDGIYKECQARFLNDFRQGHLNEAKSLAYAAELSILENIEVRLKAKIGLADRVYVERQHDDRDII